MKKHNFDWTILFYVILIPVLIVNLTIIFKANKEADKIPDIFGYKPMIVLSGSMESKIRKGDLIITKNIDPAKLEEKDVIAFRTADNTVTTHRIIEIKKIDGKLFFVTKGDNNNVNDKDMVSEDDIEGIYQFRIPKLGNLLMFIQNPLGFAVIMLSLLIVGILAFFGTSFVSDKNMSLEDKELMKEFEEFKRMKESSKNNDDVNTQ